MVFLDAGSRISPVPEFLDAGSAPDQGRDQVRLRHHYHDHNEASEAPALARALARGKAQLVTPGGGTAITHDAAGIGRDGGAAVTGASACGAHWRGTAWHNRVRTSNNHTPFSLRDL